MFKYCSFSEYSLSNLINDEIYLNHYEAFNDPFECGCEVMSGFPKKDPECIRFKAVLKAWGFDDTKDKDALENYDDYIFSLENNEPLIARYLENARIGCFSKRGDNLLMWSHYADGLRGFCIEFDPEFILTECITEALIFEVLYESVPAVIDTAVMAVLHDQVDYLEDSINAYRQEMKYQDRGREGDIRSYQEKMENDYKSAKEIYQRMLATKPMAWSYEEEVRIIETSPRNCNSGVFLKYPPNAIKSVIFGERMPAHHRKALTAVISKHPSDVVIKNASRVGGKFEITLS